MSCTDERVFTQKHPTPSDCLYFSSLPRTSTGANMYKLTRKLIHTEVEYGLLSLKGIPRDLLPSPNRQVTVVDGEGEKFVTKMHRTVSRIDGLTQLHRKHNTTIGQTVTIQIDPSRPGIIHVDFGESYTGKTAISDFPRTRSVRHNATSLKEPILQDAIDIAFSNLIQEIESAIITLNRAGAKAFEDGKYEVARDLMEKGSQMCAYRDKVKELQREWHSIFA